MGYTDIIESVIGRLAGIAPAARGESSIATGQVTSSPRYVFIWKRVTPAPPGVVARASANNPRPTQVDLHEVEVHMWGDDSTAIETLRAAALQAIRVQMGGRRYVDRGTVPGDENTSPKKGMKAVLTIGLYIELVPTKLPAVDMTHPAAKPGDDPTTTAVPASLPTVTITAIDNDPTGQTRGDGILELGEP